MKRKVGDIVSIVGINELAMDSSILKRFMNFESGTLVEIVEIDKGDIEDDNLPFRVSALNGESDSWELENDVDGFWICERDIIKEDK